MNNVRMTNPTIRIEYEVDGTEYVVEGTARDAKIDVEYGYEDVYSGSFMSKAFRTSAQTTLTADLEDGWVVTMKKPVVAKVVHTARVDVADRTIVEFEQARERAGAPKSAKMRFLADYSLADYRRLQEGVETPVDTPVPGSVEFLWEEEVRA